MIFFFLFSLKTSPLVTVFLIKLGVDMLPFVTQQLGGDVFG